MLAFSKKSPEHTAALDRVRRRLEMVRAVAADRRSELLVAGRTSAASLRWLESHTAGRVRALVEERGLRASSLLAVEGLTGDRSQATGGRAEGTTPAPRPPRSALGLILDRDGPEALGARLTELADAAVVDSRVLMAHRPRRIASPRTCSFPMGSSIRGCGR